MSRAAWLVVVAAAVGGCKGSAGPAESKPECVTSGDCVAGQECVEGRCVAQKTGSSVLDDSPCGRALANVDRLNSSQGHSAMELDLADSMKECQGWPPELVTCFEQAKDMMGYRTCAERLMRLERAKLKAKKAAAAPVPAVAKDPAEEGGNTAVAPPEAHKDSPQEGGSGAAAPDTDDTEKLLEQGRAEQEPLPSGTTPPAPGIGSIGAPKGGSGHSVGGRGASSSAIGTKNAPQEPPSLSPLPTPNPVAPE